MNKYLKKLAGLKTITTLAVPTVAGGYLGWKGGKAIAKKNKLGKDESFKTKVTGATLGAYSGLAAGAALEYKGIPYAKKLTKDTVKKYKAYKLNKTVNKARQTEGFQDFMRKVTRPRKGFGKQASWKNPSKFLGYVTGARKSMANTKVRHMEEFMANKSTLDGLKANATYEADQTTKARMVAGAGTAAATGGAVYGYKKVRDKQREETIRRYNDLLKSASAAGAAKELGGGALSGVGRILRHIGRTTLDTMNTAGGGKIKDYAVLHKMKYGGSDYKKFTGSHPKEQLRSMYKRYPTRDKKVIKEEIRNLHKSKRDARIALGSTAVAGVSAYGLHKTRQALKKTEKGYY